MLGNPLHLLLANLCHTIPKTLTKSPNENKESIKTFKNSESKPKKNMSDSLEKNFLVIEHHLTVNDICH